MLTEVIRGLISLILGDDRGQRRMAKLDQTDRKARVAQITTLYNRVEQITSQNAQNVEPRGR